MAHCDKTASQTYFLILHSLEQLLKYSMAIEYVDLVFQIKYCVYTTNVITSSLKFFYINVSSQINFWLKLKHLSIILFLYLYQHFRVRKLQVYLPLFYITTKTFFLKDQFYYKLMTAHKIQLQNAPHMWNEKWKWWVSNG